MARIRVVLVDDHAILRAGLAVLLNAQIDLQVVGEADDALGAIRRARELRPNVIVMDVGMPGIDGLGIIRQLREKTPDVKPLVLTAHEDEEFVFRALAAGAHGYVLKKAAHSDLIEAVRAVNRGEAFIHPLAVQSVLQDFIREMREGREREPHEVLTGRQWEVLGLVAQGCTSKEISDRLTLSVNTVEKHRAEIMESLNLRTRAGLVRYALRRGILRTDR